MQDIREIRKAALLILLAEAGGKKVDFAQRIRKSPSQLSQWLSGHRTITEDTARDLERSTGKPAGWMDQHPQAIGTPSIAGVAHALSQSARNTPARIAWEEITAMARALPVEFELELPDNSMARAPTPCPAGTVCTFRRSSVHTPGEGLLVRDRRGAVYFRECRLGSDGTWTAYAYSPAFPSLRSDEDGLEVLAVFAGIRIGWSQLTR